MAYGGDSGDVIKKKNLMNNWTLRAVLTNEADLTENNIGAIQQNNILNVRLAKRP